MPSKTSKRQRKHKDTQSLKFKHPTSAVNEDALDLLSDELKSQFENDGLGGELLVLPSKGKNAKQEAQQAEPAEERHISKNEKRKLQQIAKKKALRENLSQVFSSLQQSTLTDEQLALLRPLHQRGAKETKKQRLKREMKMQRAGLALPKDSELITEAPARRDDVSSEGDDDDSEDEQMLPAPAPAQQPAADDAGSSGDDAEDDSDDADAAAAEQQAAKRQKLDPAAESARLMQLARAEARKVKAELGITDEDPEQVALHQQQQREAALAAAAGPHRVVPLQRPAHIEDARSGLPITGMEQEVVEAVHLHDVVVLCGQTGCGKTTQVPQFLLEAGYGCKDFPEKSGTIGVTQPRRVAAISTAERVAAELGQKVGSAVGYQVRYDKRVGAATSIKFMTDGVLLRELQEDLLLRRYSVLLVDEAHERSLNTDLLLGLLSRVVPLRRSMHEDWRAGRSAEPVYPLKLVIMSATLRTSDFTANAKLFRSPPPLLDVPARQFPVTVHFSRRTELRDFVGAAFRKVCRIHGELPPGGVLVFLTGQREVELLCRKLRKHFAGAAAAGEQQQQQQQQQGGGGGADDAADGLVDGFGADQAEGRGDAAGDELFEGSDDFDDIEDTDGDEEEVQVLGGDSFSPEEIAAAEKHFEEKYGLKLPGAGKAAAAGSSSAQQQGPAPVHVLPLYAMLPQQQQAKVFQPPPAGHRLIIVATNVAETSLTIPGIRYVVDAGRSKQKLLEAGGSLARYEVRWVSKASAEQRAGRAGRTGPGHCYRLYSSAHFNDTFPQHTPPEILNTALEGVVLVMKSMGVDKVHNFPFPTAPDAELLAAAHKCLVALGALDQATGQLTELGSAMAAFPISPRHARMLLEVVLQQQAAAGGGGSGAKGRLKVQEAALPYAVALAAALSVESPFIHVDSVGNSKAAAGEEGEEDAEEEQQQREERRRKQQQAAAAHAKFRSEDSDALSTLAALCAFEAAGCSDSFCRDAYLHARHLREMAELRKQLARTLQQVQQGRALGSSSASSSSVLEAVSAAVAAAGKELVSELPPPSRAVRDVLRRATAAGWADQVSKRVRSSQYVQQLLQDGSGKRHALRYCSHAVEEEVYLHPRSALHKMAPEFVVYTQLVRTAKRPYMAGVTAVEPAWLAQSSSPLCKVSEPLEEPAPVYRAESDQVVVWHKVCYGRMDWALPSQARPAADVSTRAAVFAAALLEGKVLPAMAGLKGALVSQPATAARPEMRVLPRVGELVRALVQQKVGCKRELAAVWERKPSFLQQELLMWLPKGKQQQLVQLWPVLQQEAQGAANVQHERSGRSSGGKGSKKRLKP